MDGKIIRLEIYTPEKTIFNGNVDTVLLPGSKGAFQVLYNHAPLISSLEKGKVTWRSAGEEHSVPVSSGFVEVRDNHVFVCVEV